MYSCTLCFLTSLLDGSGWSTPRPSRFTPWNDSVPIVYEAEWDPGPVWKGADDSPLPEFDPRTVQPIASRYTDYAVAALRRGLSNLIYARAIIIIPSSSIRSFINSVLSTAIFLVDGCSIALNCSTLLSTLGSSPSSLFILGGLMV